ncbi:hypothetical protein [endosymbiont GvMRE of Glomus versiforme]|uniref:hypothetical protein n=1 Tax=endosymbiont GvMRE of Glomus versiforme TaxID=2039283 RepID=UPI000EBD3033|nr:hypothetical protein [endosymbiont GvMRE of Glomus versiforme]RHZ36465.1 hypothetical protein GvMRE_I2g460 [endosymbiont GvMRE of Glomus versiforme]
MDAKIRKLELEKEIARAERERDRSLKWFFVNLFAFLLAVAIAWAILWFMPILIAKMSKKALDANGVIKKPLPYADKIRMDYIKWGMFVFVFAWVTTWIFWALFRFRKWTSYQHRIDALREELAKLEKEK